MEPEERHKMKHIDINKEIVCDALKRDENVPEEVTLAKKTHTH